jgi:hypothetical protein
MQYKDYLTNPSKYMHKGFINTKVK